MSQNNETRNDGKPKEEKKLTKEEVKDIRDSREKVIKENQTVKK